MSGIANNGPSPQRLRSGKKLPVVNTRASTAYGSRGKATLQAQVTSRATEIDEAFDNMRATHDEAAPAERRSEQAEAAAELAAGSKPSTPSSDAKKASSRAGSSSGSPSVVEAAASRPQQPEASRRSEQGTRSPSSGPRNGAAAEDGVAARPAAGPAEATWWSSLWFCLRLLIHYYVVAFWTFVRWIPFIIVALTIYAWGPVPDWHAPRRDEFFRGLKIAAGLPGWDQPPAQMEYNWHMYKHDKIFTKLLPDHNMPEMQFAININFLHRIEKLEKQVTELASQTALHDDTLKALWEMLPPSIVMEKNEDGDYVITTQFWNALSDRLANGESSVLWQAFVTGNEQKLYEMTEVNVEKAIDKAVETHYIVTSKSFTNVIDEHFERLRSTYHEDFIEMEKQHKSYLESIASETALDVFDKSGASAAGKQQLETLVKANQIHDTYMAMRNVNFFSPGNGARVDPYLTSPTHQKSANSFLKRMYVSLVPALRNTHPPIHALERWSETTDCWCTTPSKMGKAQLTVTTPMEIYPDLFVVEHIPKEGTLNIGAAPKEIELWADMKTSTAAHELEKVYAELMLADWPCGTPPGPNYVCIAKAHYDIHHSRYIQTFYPKLSAQHNGIHSNKFTVRVTENWGSDWTCLYRVRLTGSPVDETLMDRPN